MIGERMNLKWNKFRETAEKAFIDLGSSGDFSDVTLASADGQQVEAHRVIMSSCSPVLRRILVKISHPHPILYMKGMSMVDLSNLVKFVYTGEISIEQESIENFLETANELQIAGLTKSNTHEDGNDMNTMVCQEREELREGSKAIEESEAEEVFEENVKIEADCENEYTDLNIDNICHYQDCRKQFSNGANLKKHIKNLHQIYECLKNDDATKTEENVGRFQQIDSVSEEGKNHTCDRCGVENKSGKAFMKHRQQEHPGETFLCKECGKEFVSNNNLNIHKKSAHLLVRYKCDDCDSQFTCKSSLHFHKNKKHTI